MRSVAILIALVGTLGLSAPVTAAEAGQEKTSVPGHLMSMEKVKSAYGAPDRTLDAVGDPPIVRWVYSGYTVYFEHEAVLTSVRHRAP